VRPSESSDSLKGKIISFILFFLLSLSLSSYFLFILIQFFSLVCFVAISFVLFLIFGWSFPPQVLNAHTNREEKTNRCANGLPQIPPFHFPLHLLLHLPSTPHHVAVRFPRVSGSIHTRFDDYLPFRVSFPLFHHWPTTPPADSIFSNSPHILKTYSVGYRDSFHTFFAKHVWHAHSHAN
jgi:hypothetical protein